jgi:hypothetical protein
MLSLSCLTDISSNFLYCHMKRNERLFMNTSLRSWRQFMDENHVEFGLPFDFNYPLIDTSHSPQLASGCELKYTVVCRM